jgi:hypothetical protein
VRSEIFGPDEPDASWQAAAEGLAFCDSLARCLASCFHGMKQLTPLLLLLITPLMSGEDVTLKQSAILKSGRTLVSLKPGTVVELISRDGSDITIKHKDLTGKIPASKLEEDRSPPAPSAPAAKSTPPARKPAPPVAKAKKEKPPERKPGDHVVDNPQTGYGKAVKKAKDNAAAHDRNVVRPNDDVLKDE